jgi:hypothetical protein
MVQKSTLPKKKNDAGNYLLLFFLFILIYDTYFDSPNVIFDSNSGNQKFGNPKYLRNK